MNRREAVRSVAFLMGGALSATTIGVFLEGCNSPSTTSNGSLFTDEQQQLITEIADIIIPATKTPGAKEAGVGPFIALMIKDCYPEDAQKAFVKGLEDLEKRSNDTYKKSFLEISVKEREALIGKLREETIEGQKLDSEEKKAKEEKASGFVKEAEIKEPAKPYFYAIARDLTLLGYFTSEIGATQAYEYVDIPGRYDGCVDLKPGQRYYS